AFGAWRGPLGFQRRHRTPDHRRKPLIPPASVVQFPYCDCMSQNIADKPPLIRLREVQKKFATADGSVFEAVRSVSLEVRQGEIFGLIGKSGAGKSTLLRLINLLERPDAGEVFLAGRELTRLSRRELRDARQNIGMIFQQFNLLQNASVF